MDPIDAAEIARRMRAAVVLESPRHPWILPMIGLLVGAIAVLGFALVRR
ncbi:hypothetical protein [Aeromicrobium sp.]|nr:hypothetical protein [Aeromicrobium sp.]MBC7630689.1 hypothetical protein [Aeromicrobium sp.]